MNRCGRTRIPSYRRHKPSNQAVVSLNGRDFYLGRWKSPESRAEYERLVSEWLAAGSSPAAPDHQRMVGELILAYWRHANAFYRKNGHATSEVTIIKRSLAPVRRLYSRRPIGDFGPIALKSCRDVLIAEGLSRSSINKYVSRIRRMFRWGVENELIPVSIHQSLQAVSGLRAGRTEAKETERVEPVLEAHVRAVFPHLSRPVRAMVELQLWTWMRPGEVCSMRMGDLQIGGETWTYRPSSHKTEHHGKPRVIVLGPRAQAAVRPFLSADPEAFLFSPIDAERERHELQRKNRKSPLTPSQRKRKPKPHPKRSPRERYTTASYARAIARACVLAEVPHWFPNQLRHTAATRIRSQYGIETARIILGHSSVATSEIYAEPDREKARQVMQEVG